MNCENHFGASCPNCHTGEKTGTEKRLESLEATVRRMETLLKVAREDLILLEEGIVQDLHGPQKIKIKLEPGAKLPVRSTDGAAAWDLFANITEPVTIQPGERAKVPTGVAAQLPAGFFWDLRARSGLSFNHGLMLINGAAIIDEDYRGISQIGYFNTGAEPYTVQPGEKLAQAVLSKYYAQEFILVDELDDTKRGDGGFGHTGNGLVCEYCEGVGLVSIGPGVRGVKPCPLCRNR